MAFEEIEGLQSTLNTQRQYHCGDKSEHWVTACYLDNKIVVYDSLSMKSLPEELRKQLTEYLYGKYRKALDIAIPEVQKLSNIVDCECMEWLAIGEKPEIITLDKESNSDPILSSACRQRAFPLPAYQQEKS